MLKIGDWVQSKDPNDPPLIVTAENIGLIDKAQVLEVRRATATERSPTTWRASVDPAASPLAQVADALRHKAEQEEWARWLKYGETPLQRVEREHRDNQTLLRELAKAKDTEQQIRARIVALTAEVQALRAELKERDAEVEVLAAQMDRMVSQMEDEPKGGD